MRALLCVCVCVWGGGVVRYDPNFDTPQWKKAGMHSELKVTSYCCPEIKVLDVLDNGALLLGTKERVSDKSVTPPPLWAC